MTPFAHRGLAIVLLALCAGCARETYRPKPLEPEATQRAYESRTLSAPEVRDYFAAQGQDTAAWPPAQWTLPMLTLAAVRLHPEIELARARAQVTSKEKHTSTTPVPYTVTARPEFDGKSEGDLPWGLGVLVGVTLDIGNKRGIRTEQLARLEDAAQLEIAVASWRVRSRLRRHFVELHAATRTLEALDAEHVERERLVALMTKRAAVGYASRADVSTLNVRLAESALARARAAVRRDQALAALAEAVGVPLAELERTRLDFGALERPIEPPAAASVRRVALVNRIDLRRKLADYAAAEAAVKLEVARQYPDLTLVPGYFWDADQSLWSISFLGLLPPSARAKALIAEAEARRTVEEKAFGALQATVIAESSAAASRYQRAFDAHRAAQAQIDAAKADAARVAKQFDRGNADRVELAQSRLDAATIARTATVAMLELQQGLSALEDAVQRPLDNPDLATTPAASSSAPAATAIDPALIDND